MHRYRVDEAESPRGAENLREDEELAEPARDVCLRCAGPQNSVFSWIATARQLVNRTCGRCVPHPPP